MTVEAAVRKRKAIQLLPVGTRLLLKRVREEESPGGIIVPKTAEDHALIGEVVATGPECEVVQVGDMVYFARFSGKEIKMDMTLDVAEDWQDVIVMCEEDVVCVIREEY